VTTSSFAGANRRVTVLLSNDAGEGDCKMSKGAAMQPDFAAIEMEALEHVWIHSARWLDLAERDGLRAMVRAEGCRLFERAWPVLS
jgi:hypothetical protein